MKPLVIRKEVVIDAPVARVWAFVATQDGLQKWWHPHRIRLEERLGGRYEEEGETAAGETFRLFGTITTYDPPQGVEMSCRGDFGDGTTWPADTYIAITLQEQNGRTHVTVLHSGFERLPEAYRERVFKGIGAGWARVMERLPRFLRALDTTVTQRIAASRADVFHGLIEPVLLARWFCDVAEVEHRVGGRYAFGGARAYGGPDVVRGWITRFEPESALGYTWPLAGAETTVAMELRLVNAQETDLVVHHQGVVDLPVPWLSPEHLLVVWQVLLRQLDACLTGRDLPRFDFTVVPPPVVDQEILIGAPATRVWELLTTPAQLDRWIARKASVELRVGGRFSYGWDEDGPYGSGPLRILALEPPGLLRVSWREVGGLGTVTWHLQETADGRTRLRLVHEGLGSLPGVLRDYHVGWWEFLTGLRWLMEA